MSHDVKVILVAAAVWCVLDVLHSAIGKPPDQDRRGAFAIGFAGGMAASEPP